jgi:hypothetical protein
MHKPFSLVGANGLKAGVAYLRLRGQWSAYTCDPARSGSYDHEVFDTYEQALDSLRVRAPWADLPRS